MSDALAFTYRLAERRDVDATAAQVAAAIDYNMRASLSRAEIAAAKDTLGVDRTLIGDDTYSPIHAHDALVGCGG